VTLVSTLVKSNWQVSGDTPNDSRTDYKRNGAVREREKKRREMMHTWIVLVWVASSDWMAVSCSMATFPEVKPAARKSLGWNLASACV
jgi:hypothetical protein